MATFCERRIRLHAVVGIVLGMALSAFSDNLGNAGSTGLVRCISARTLGFTSLNIGAGFKYDQDFRYVWGPDGVSNVVSDGVVVRRTSSPRLLSGDIFVAYGLASIWDISVAFPLYYDITGWDERTRAGVGDLEIATKLALPVPRKKNLFGQALYLRLITPTGHGDRGYFPRHLYHIENDPSSPGDHPFTADTWLLNPMLVWSLHFDNIWRKFPLQIHGNLGAVVTTPKRNSVLTGAVGLEIQPVRVLTLFCEVSGEARVSTYADNFSVRHFENHPLLLTPGARLNLPNGIHITVAGDIGLSSDEVQYRTTWDRDGTQYSTTPVPKYGAQVTLGWGRAFYQYDSDKDGILDKNDACPNEPEDKDGFQDEDGCPEPDNDNDGILDGQDKCPNEAATCDGCPVYDKDEDGIMDDKDKCPDRAEDMDGFEDTDGCPDPDNDKDGVMDSDDRCPTSPEDLDGFEDQDGCPDLDNDRDGVADEWDRCRDIPGPADNNGCPKTKEIPRGPLILRGVNFQSGKAILTPASYRALDEVYESLAEWKEVRLEIQGHTDSQGSDAANLKLSQQRAEAVRQYLIRKGIDPSRLTAVGYGETRPIADNSTAEGRAQNRRVELHRTD